MSDLSSIISEFDKAIHSHHDLVAIASKWVNKKLNFPVVATELKCIGSREIPDVLAFRAQTSLIIECKTSLADFRKDFTKPERNGSQLGVGNYRLYCAPAGLIPIDRIPDSWGLMEVDHKGKIDLVKFKQGNIYHNNDSPEHYKLNDSFFHDSDIKKERAFLYSILIRRSSNE
ncbi:MmcB family DNA repair protein (plasmid) [Acinetobacter soli]|nr:MmcB family DNA repair protein [Acinetobacter soli]